MSIAVIAGLGNPGQNYCNTRHNTGFSVIDALAEFFGAKWKTESRFQANTASMSYRDHKLLLAKPITFMNDSGRALQAILKYKKLPSSSLLVIYDDITLEPGRPKLSVGGSAGGHNGIADILSRTGSTGSHSSDDSGFARYRIGIGGKPDRQMDLADYVLGKFSADEQKVLADRTPDYIEHIQLIIDKGPLQAMNSINKRTASTHERTK